MRPLDFVGSRERLSSPATSFNLFSEYVAKYEYLFWFGYKNISKIWIFFQISIIAYR